MKKKLLIIGKLPPPYMGPSVAFELLLQSDLQERFNLYHLDIKANESLDTLGKFSIGKVGTNIRVYKKFASLLKQVRPDMVLIPISQTTMGFVKDSVFILLCRIYGIRCVIQLRGSNFRKWADASGLITKKYISFILKIPAGVIVLGEKLRYLFENYFRPDQIFVVPNGGNYPQVQRDKITDRPFTFLYLANLQASKGIEDVIEAVSIVRKQSSIPFSMQVAGQWRSQETRDKCIKKVKTEQLPVTFLEPLKGEEKFRFLAGGDAFVFTPREPEGHPWVIIEAMSAGLPIISTDQGAITESVIDGSNGYIVQTGSPQAIASKMVLFLETPETARTLGRQSRNYYEERFTEQKMTANLASVIETLCKES